MREGLGQCGAGVKVVRTSGWALRLTFVEGNGGFFPGGARLVIRWVACLIFALCTHPSPETL